MPLDPAAVEADLTKYYDAEGDARSDRPVDPRRVAARDQFLARLAGSERLVLEIGSGPGRDAGSFHDAGHHVAAIDLSIEHLRRCRATGASAVRATARQLPFAVHAFDAVWSMSTLMHVPNSTIEGVLADIARVLRPDGLAAIGVWGGPDIEDNSVKDRASGSPPRLFSRRSSRRWRELLATIGDVEGLEEWGDDPDFTYQLAVVRRA